MPQLAEDLLQVLDEVAGDGPVVLVGHSMGGMTIMHLARTHPELFGTRIRGVALFSTSAGEMADHSPIRGLPGRTFSRIAQPLMADPQPDPRARRTWPAGRHPTSASSSPDGWPTAPMSRRATSSS